MSQEELVSCPGCEALLPPSNNEATHRYIGASPACWALYSALCNAGEPPLAPTPFEPLLVDAYAAQHPGTPSPQAIQSVAVHLLVLYGVLQQGEAPSQSLWLRRRALRERGHFHWLTPPSFAGSLSVADIVQGPGPAARSELLARYVEAVWQRWSAQHRATLRDWYERFVLTE